MNHFHDFLRLWAILAGLLAAITSTVILVVALFASAPLLSVALGIVAFTCFVALLVTFLD